MFTSYNALVILGNRNSGKDSVAERLRLENFEKPFVNVKFGAYNKRLIESALTLPEGTLDNKNLRTVPLCFHTGCTPLDFVDVLFQGMSSGTDAAKRLQDYIQLETLQGFIRNHEQNDCIPVFTDVRRVEELRAIKREFTPLVFVLDGGVRAPGAETDQNLSDILKEVGNSLWFYTGEGCTLDETVNEVVKEVQAFGLNKLIEKNDKRFLYICSNPAFFNATLQRGRLEYRPWFPVQKQMSQLFQESFALIDATNAVVSQMNEEDWIEGVTLEPLPKHSFVRYSRVFAYNNGLFEALKKIEDLEVVFCHFAYSLEFADKLVTSSTSVKLICDQLINQGVTNQ